MMMILKHHVSYQATYCCIHGLDSSAKICWMMLDALMGTEIIACEVRAPHHIPGCPRHIIQPQDMVWKCGVMR